MEKELLGSTIVGGGGFERKREAKRALKELIPEVAQPGLSQRVAIVEEEVVYRDNKEEEVKVRVDDDLEDMEILTDEEASLSDSENETKQTQPRV